jgi:hypothetical protein
LETTAKERRRWKKFRKAGTLLVLKKYTVLFLLQNKNKVHTKMILEANTSTPYTTLAS